MKEEKEGGGLWWEWIKREDLEEGKKYTAIEAAEILGIRTKSSKPQIVFKRYLFWYYLRTREKRLTLSEIGEITGGHCHSTVLKGIQYASDKWKRNRYLKHYEREVLTIILQTDLYHDSKKRSSL